MNADQLTTLLAYSFFINFLFLAVFFWKKNFLWNSIICHLKKWRLAEVKHFKEGRVVATYWLPDPRKVNLKQGVIKKLFSNLPEWIHNAEIPPIPYAIGQENLNTYYEFHGEIPKAIDPYSRQPDIEIYSKYESDIAHAFDMGLRKQGLFGGSTFNLLLALMIMASLGLSLMTLNTINDQKTIIQSQNQTLTDLNIGFNNLHPIDINQIPTYNPNEPINGIVKTPK